MASSEVIKEQNRFLLISFLISPFLTLLITMYHYRWKASRLFFVLSASFLGYCIGIEGDLNRYHDWFFVYGEQSWYSILYSVFTFKAGDIYTLLLSKIVYSFTDNVKIYFAILMGIFAYFYSAVITVIINRFKQDNTKILLLFIGFATFFFVRSFIGLRFSTASLLYTYSLLEVVLNNRKKFILLSLCAPLVHISFLVTIPLIPLYYILKNNTRVCVILLILSFAINQGNMVNFFGHFA